jgi:hypothetical protein
MLTGHGEVFFKHWLSNAARTSCGIPARREVSIGVPSRGDMSSVTVARERIYCMVSPNPIATLDDCVSKLNP